MTVVEDHFAAGASGSMPPGWYDDDASAHVLRWWDGSAWTEHTSPLPSGPRQPRPGWYDDQRTPDVLRWWDGLGWREQMQPAPFSTLGRPSGPGGRGEGATAVGARAGRHAEVPQSGERRATSERDPEYVGLLGTTWVLRDEGLEIRRSGQHRLIPYAEIDEVEVKPLDLRTRGHIRLVTTHGGSGGGAAGDPNAILTAGMPLRFRPVNEQLAAFADKLRAQVATRAGDRRHHRVAAAHARAETHVASVADAAEAAAPSAQITASPPTPEPTTETEVKRTLPTLSAPAARLPEVEARPKPTVEAVPEVAAGGVSEGRQLPAVARAVAAPSVTVRPAGAVMRDHRRTGKQHARTRPTMPALYRAPSPSWPQLGVVGVSHYQPAIQRVLGPLRRGQERELMVEAIVESEPTNRHDRNALVVRIGGDTVGYISRDDGPEYRPVIQRIEVAGARLATAARVWGRRDGDGLFCSIRLATGQPHLITPLNTPPAEPYSIIPWGRRCR